MFDKSKILPISSDHAGFEMKEFLKQKLTEAGYQIQDFGTYSTASVDYPDFAHPVASAVNSGEFAMGIIICGSGNGVNMVANKYPNVRSALCWTPEIVRLARLHNDANILCLPGRFVELESGWEMARTFLETDFEGGRHAARVAKIAVKGEE